MYLPPSISLPIPTRRKCEVHRKLPVLTMTTIRLDQRVLDFRCSGTPVHRSIKKFNPVFSNHTRWSSRPPFPMMTPIVTWTGTGHLVAVLFFFGVGIILNLHSMQSHIRAVRTGPWNPKKFEWCQIWVMTLFSDFQMTSNFQDNPEFFEWLEVVPFPEFRRSSPGSALVKIQRQWQFQR
jgi:hypothetical protein